MSILLRPDAPQLRAPEWLVALAAQDNPSTALEPFIKRLSKVGVDFLEPGAEGKVAEAATSPDAIVALGEGLRASATLDAVSAPVGAALEELAVALKRFDRLRRLRLAAVDMRLVEGAAEALADRDGPARFHERVLETGLVVTYAPAYLRSNRAGLAKGDTPTEAADVKLHREVVTLRHRYHAHADRIADRTLIDTTAMLGIDGPPTFSEQWSRLSVDKLMRLADLARRQAERFEVEAASLGRDLGEEQDDEP